MGPNDSRSTRLPFAQRKGLFLWADANDQGKGTERRGAILNVYLFLMRACLLVLNRFSRGPALFWWRAGLEARAMCVSLGPEDVSPILLLFNRLISHILNVYINRKGRKAFYLINI